jgi:uncharacterized membrane protein YbhN (UPF0104 family)
MLGTVAVDHLTSSASLLVGLALFGLVAPLPRWAHSGAWTFLVATTIAAAVALLLHRRSPAPQTSGVLARSWEGLREGLGSAARPSAVLASCGAGLVSWVMEVVVALLCLPAFHVAPSPAVGVALVLATTISAAAAVSPGNAGAFEVASMLALAGFGVPGERALALALGYHAAHVVPVALLGGASMLRAGGRRATEAER